MQWGFRKEPPQVSRHQRLHMGLHHLRQHDPAGSAKEWLLGTLGSTVPSLFVSGEAAGHCGCREISWALISAHGLALESAKPTHPLGAGWHVTPMSVLVRAVVARLCLEVE